MLTRPPRSSRSRGAGTRWRRCRSPCRSRVDVEPRRLLDHALHRAVQPAHRALDALGAVDHRPHAAPVARQHRVGSVAIGHRSSGIVGSRRTADRTALHVPASCAAPRSCAPSDRCAPVVAFVAALQRGEVLRAARRRGNSTRSSAAAQRVERDEAGRARERAEHDRVGDRPLEDRRARARPRRTVRPVATRSGSGSSASGFAVVCTSVACSVTPSNMLTARATVGSMHRTQSGW